MRLINEDIGILRDIAFKQVLQFADGFKVGVRHPEIPKDIGP